MTPEEKRTKQRNYYVKNKEKIQRRVAEWSKAHPDAANANRQKWVKNHPEENLVAKRLYKGNLPLRPCSGICDICGCAITDSKEPGKKKACSEHDHKTGKWRGWTCTYCNAVLITAHEHPLAPKVRAYLEKNQ
jgi:Recombination endonuclease VII